MPNFPRHRRFLPHELKRVRLQARNALVTFVLNGTPLPVEIVQRMQLDPRVHFESVEDGRFVTIPFPGGRAPKGAFTVQKDGWSKETCETCPAVILAGEECWESTVLAGQYLCEKCRDEVLQHSSRKTNPPPEQPPTAG